jgi:hypothetical protein
MPAAPGAPIALLLQKPQDSWRSALLLGDQLVAESDGQRDSSIELSGTAQPLHARRSCVVKSGRASGAAGWKSAIERVREVVSPLGRDSAQVGAPRRRS